MATDLSTAVRQPSSRSRSPSPAAVPPSTMAAPGGADHYSNLSANPALASPPDASHSHRKRSRSRSPSYHRRRSPSPMYHDRSKPHSNGGGKGTLPGAVSIFGPPAERSRDVDEHYRPRERRREREGDGERMPRNDGVCYSWPSGSCKYGDSCFFKHLDESGRDVRKNPPPPPVKRNAAAYPASNRMAPPTSSSAAFSASASSAYPFPKDKSCFEFRNEGRCRFGSRCKYVHDTNNAAAPAVPHYGRPTREFYDRYAPPPPPVAGVYPPPPHMQQQFGHRRRSRSRDRRSRSRSPRQRSHRSRSR